MNERWRVALAGLVAALAIPFLIIDSPEPAEGVETKAEETTPDLAATAEIAIAPVEPEASDDAVVDVVPTNAVEIVVMTTEVSPDIARLADQSGTWGLARAQAIEDGRVDATFRPPPSKTDYSLLPVVDTTPAVVEEVEAPGPGEESAEPAPQPGSEDEPAPDPEEGPGDSEAPADEQVDPDGEVTEQPEPGELDEPAPEADPKPAPDPVEPETPVVQGPAAPPQVDGRVPPPNGGPTAQQWDALRKCESTHNYAAISPSGLYRGAYQFSQQTWDWVAGIHWPHLVGIDPIDADPAWQDVMAYTLYAMRGWDQWPICGKNLL